MSSVCTFVKFMAVLSVPLHHKYPLYCSDINVFICYQSMQYCTDCTYSSLSITSAYHTCFSSQSLTQTMCLICQLLTEEPDGGCDMIPFETFKELYTYLAQMNCSSGEDQETSDFIVPV